MNAPLRVVVALAIALGLAAPLGAAQLRSSVASVPARAVAVAQAPARPTTCASPDGPQPEGTVRCEMCPVAAGARVQYRPMACTAGKWTEAGPCAEGDCGGRTY